MPDLEDLEYDPQFETEEEDVEPQSYIFDPDMKEEEEIVFDPARRRKSRRRTPRRYSPRVVYRYLKKKVKKRKKPKWLGLNTMIAIPTFIVSFLFTMQKWTIHYYVTQTKESILKAFSLKELAYTFVGGHGRPKDIGTYLKNVFTSPFGLGGVALAIYGLLPIRRLPLKRIALILGGSLLLGALLGSGMHESNENPNNPNGGSWNTRSSISERKAYSHVLAKDPFNSTYT